MKRTALLLALLIASAAAAVAQYQVSKLPLADPFVFYEDGTYYAYGTYSGDGIVVFTGSINALKRFKDDVKEVGTNFECGISLTACNDLKVGDIIETYEEIEVKATL